MRPWRARSLTRSLPFLAFALICFWPGINFVTDEVAQAQWISSSTLVLVLLLCGMLWLIGVGVVRVCSISIAGWSNARAYSTGVVAVFGLFAHENARHLLVDELSISSTIAASVYLCLLLAAVGTAWYLTRHKPVQLALTIAAALMLAVSLGKLWMLQSIDPTPQQALVDHQGAFGEPRSLSGQNVYYIILDGYAGQSTLKQYLHYDVEPFLRQMSDLGYVHIPRARSNYTTTYASIMATLEMEYVIDGSTGAFTSRAEFFPHRLQRGAAPRVIRRLHSANYSIVHIGNSYVHCHPRKEIQCLGAGAPGRVASIAAKLLAPTKLPQALGRIFGEDGALATLYGAVADLNKRTQPFFVFAHHLSPHPPYTNADCSPAQAGPSNRDAYKTTIECVNRTVASLAARIEAVDPGAIVVFQADHGSDFEVDWKRHLAAWSAIAIDERTSIMNLVRVPPLCRQWLEPNLSPINTMRLVMACLERRTPQYVEERSYLTTYERYPDFGMALDVTNRLPAQPDVALGTTR